ncbi:MAG: gliding-motility protein MglA, partial [Myxococcaceae bacterium]
EYVQAKTDPAVAGKLLSLVNEHGTVTSFDFILKAVGEVGGYKVRVHLVGLTDEAMTVPSRKVVFKDVDGIVFVADSDPARAKDNVAALKSLRKLLDDEGQDLSLMPFVLQLDNRSHPKAMAPDEMKNALGLTAVKTVEAESKKGVGVFDSLMEVLKLVLRALRSGADGGH